MPKRKLTDSVTAQVQRLVMAPCPFCGSESVDVMHVTGSTTGWAVWCQDCGGQGPAVQGDVMAARQKTAELWNKRAFWSPCDFCEQLVLRFPDVLDPSSPSYDPDDDGYRCLAAECTAMGRRYDSYNR